MQLPLASVSATARVVGVQIHADGAPPPVRNHRHFHHLGGREHPPALAHPA